MLLLDNKLIKWKMLVSSVGGQFIRFQNITRRQMAAYTCYANNGIAPVANATFLVEVHCKPFTLRIVIRIYPRLMLI